MNEGRARAALLSAFVFVVAVVTWQEIKGHLLPRPRRYIGAGLVYGTLGIAGPIISWPVAGWLGIALAVALLYNSYAKGGGGSNPPGPNDSEAEGHSPVRI